MTHAEIEAFLAKDLTGDLAKDFKGISEAAAGKINDSLGCANSWMFFGIALTSDDANDFESTCKEGGVAASYSATVVHQVVEKLAAGVKLPFE